MSSLPPPVAPKIPVAANDGWRIAQVTLAHERGTNYAIKEQVLARID